MKTVFDYILQTSMPMIRVYAEKLFLSYLLQNNLCLTDLVVLYCTCVDLLRRKKR